MIQYHHFSSFSPLKLHFFDKPNLGWVKWWHPTTWFFSPRWWPITAWTMKGEVVAQSPSQPDMLSVNMWTFCLTTSVWNGCLELLFFLDLCWTSVWDCPIQVRDGVCFIHICSKLSRPVFQYGFRSKKTCIVNPDLAGLAKMFAATHDPVKSSGNPLCHPLHWSIVARNCPIKMDHGDHVQLGRWAGQGFRPQKSHGFRASKNYVQKPYRDQGEVPELDGAWNMEKSSCNQSKWGFSSRPCFSTGRYDTTCET